MKKDLKEKEMTKDLMVKPAQNFGLKEEEFIAMLQKMKSGDESLFEKVFLAQFDDCIKYLMFRYKINYSLAYDVTMDALLKFRKRLLAGKSNSGNMRFLFTRMASQFLSDNKKMHTVLLDDEREESEEKESIDDDVLDALDQAWNELGEGCRTVLDHFYYRKITLKTLANNIGKTEVALRKQKQRCLEKLRTYFLSHHKY